MNDYQSLALRTWNTQAPPLSDADKRLLNAVLGLTGEAGELANEIKKSLFHGHGMDHESLADELGDVLWYVAAIAKELGYSLDSVATTNIDKLRRRYPNGFEVERSLNREVVP